MDWSFDTTKTFSVIKTIKDKGCDDFHDELTELLWFGEVLSYGNIMHETKFMAGLIRLISWISRAVVRMITVSLFV